MIDANMERSLVAYLRERTYDEHIIKLINLSTTV